MNFLSIKEFFYKLNTIGFILLLLPVIVFLYLHIAALKSIPMIIDERQHDVLLIIGCVFVAVALTTVNLFWRSRIRQLKVLGELSRKMDGYFVLVVVRQGVYAAGLLLLAGGYYLTHSIYFSGVYMVVVLALIAQWPGPARFCMTFELRGPEKDLVLHNQDLPRKSRTRN
ncbi:MAG: hypothetical protein JNL40_07070 [Cyclobacteriaceae bacterium]|nr:hypothetical protein [Cyclobacteriaceae bacterium]